MAHEVRSTLVQKKKWIPSYTGNVGVVIGVACGIGLYHIGQQMAVLIGAGKAFEITDAQKLGSLVMLLAIIFAIILVLAVLKPIAFEREFKEVEQYERVPMVDPVDRFDTAQLDAEIEDAVPERPASRGEEINQPVAASPDAPDADSPESADGLEGRDDGLSDDAPRDENPAPFPRRKGFQGSHVPETAT